MGSWGIDYTGKSSRCEMLFGDGISSFVSRVSFSRRQSATNLRLSIRACRRANDKSTLLQRRCTSTSLLNTAQSEATCHAGKFAVTPCAHR